MEYTKVLLGQLIKQTRAMSMDQHELALRTGASKNTISRLELVVAGILKITVSTFMRTKVYIGNTFMR